MRALGNGLWWAIVLQFAYFVPRCVQAEEPVDRTFSNSTRSAYSTTLSIADSGDLVDGGNQARSSAVEALRIPLRRCLAWYFFRPESNEERGPWGVMHTAIGFGVDTPLQVGSRTLNAIGWLCWNRPCYDRQLLSSNGRDVVPRMGPGYQGHDGQFLQVLALARVPAEYVLKVEGEDFTIEDLVRHEQSTCKSGNELTFKFTGLVHYLGTEATWRSRDGERWSIERLLKEELEQPVVGAACGGTHRVMAISCAVRRRQKEGKPMSEPWLRADEYVGQLAERAMRLQNADGSFSTNWFQRAGDVDDIDRRLETTGHTLEWLLLYLPDDQLEDPHVLRAVRYLTGLMWDERGRDWEIGPKGHAIHALALYDERVFGGRPGQRRAELARMVSDGQRY